MTTKTCWQCMSEVHPAASVCPQCKAKLGIMKSNGMASKPLGCWAWGAIIFGVLFLVGFIPGQILRQKAELAELKKSEDAARERDARQSALRAIPASEHIAWARQEIQSLRKSWSNEKYVALTERLMVIPDDSPEKKEAGQIAREAAALDARAIKEIARAQKAQEESLAKAQEPERRAYAKTLENELLDKRMNADVTTSGKDHTVITIKWALVSKVTARDIEKNDGLHENLRRLHFKKLVITDGYRESWYWTY